MPTQYCDDLSTDPIIIESRIYATAEKKVSSTELTISSEKPFFRSSTFLTPCLINTLLKIKI